MSSQPPVGDAEQRWQQPAWDPGQQQAAPPPLPVMPFTPPVPVRYPPPSALESTVATIAGLIWPAMILLAILGYVGWWPAMIIALVSHVVADGVRKHLRARRKALAPPPQAGGELR